MKQVLIQQGRVIVEDIPAPVLEPGTVLVSVRNSCISIGTELSGIKATGLPLWKRALKQPQKIKQVIEMVASQGLSRTLTQVQGKVAEAQATGYSAAGIVMEVGAGIGDLAPGDRVACAGAQFAHHAEIIRVPRNLVAPMPDGLDFEAASTVTLGAIALQGVRRASPTLGETFVVLGLGVLGQLTAQLLHANGCRVAGTDLDRGRIQTALEHGMNVGVHPEDGNEIEQVVRLTGGLGADGVIITAATPSDAVISTAFKMCRKKGRVVLVGDVGLNLNRADFYAKELDFFISCSYGPGRYDHRYEEEGADYPVAYIRWTENRNMEEFLRLLAEGRVKVAPLISLIHPVENATEGYAALQQGTTKPLMVLLSYHAGATAVPLKRTVARVGAVSPKSGLIRIAIAGAGSFTKGMHLPHLKELSSLYHLRAVMSRTGHNAANLARQFVADYSATDYQEVLKDPEVDAVLIGTRHNLHARMALDALKAGKHVLLEKPLALEPSELNEIQAFFNDPPVGPAKPVLLTGFNRRFSPHAKRIAEVVAGRSAPMILNYRMNAGYLPMDHWVHGPEGGGRNRGEACHIYDLFTFLTAGRVTEVAAQAIKPKGGQYAASDNFVVTLRFDEGSVATLTYTALGSKDHAKEMLDIFVDGKVISLNDYQELKISGVKGRDLRTNLVDKGHKAELEAFARVITTGGDWPIPLWQQIQATEIALSVESSLAKQPADVKAN